VIGPEEMSVDSKESQVGREGEAAVTEDGTMGEDEE
jgi:hypothetical protein